MTRPTEVKNKPEDEVKCDNHPDVDARTYTGGGSYRINLCEACTPSWFTE